MGCDYTSKFCTKHAALKANPEKYLLQVETMNDIDKTNCHGRRVPGAGFQEVTNLQIT